MKYEFNGKEYEKYSSHQKEWGNKLVSELGLAGNERILDLGCGDGRITESLADLVPDGNVLGIDASQGMIDIAQKKARGNLSFKLMDIGRLNLLQKPEEFDVIFSNAALHWIKNHRKLWEYVENMISDGGIVRYNFAADGNCSHFFKVVRNALTLNEYKPFFFKFQWPWFMPKVDTYNKIIDSFNFSEVNVWGENDDRIFPDKESIVGWINHPSIVPFLRYLPENKKEDFKNYVIEKMLQDTAQENGGYFETFRRINVFAKK